MLYAIVFLSGACLMCLELVGARVLAPALGNSIFVWGSVISTFMVALSAGYWLGGQAADRYGAGRTLAPVTGAAGVLTVVAPFVSRAVLLPSASLGPRVGSLVAATLIFFAPALLLAMVSPLGVRLASTRGIEHIGRSAGGLYSVSTGGSIVGTIGTAFWLIPLLELEPLIVWTGFLLLATALLCLALPLFYPEQIGEKTARLASLPLYATIALAVAGVALGAFVLVKVAPPPKVNEFGETVLLRRDTQYHRITVTEDAKTRHLRFDRSHQSASDIDDPYISRIAYPDYMHLAVAVHPAPTRVLVLGLGGGSITKRFWRDYAPVSVDSVEIDPVVVDVARRSFALPTDPRLHVYEADARRFVQTARGTYDIVVVDAYYAESLPYHLTTEEFFREARSRMTTDGVLAYNVISAAEGGDSKLFRSMYRTAGAVFEHLWVFPIGLGTEGGPSKPRNIIVLASDVDLTRAELLARIRSRVGGTVSIPGYTGMAADLYTGAVHVADVPLLTDAYTPTDSLIKVQ